MTSFEFQTPHDVCEFMSSLLPNNAGLILEPTPGIGNLVKSLQKKGSVITPKGSFFDIDNSSKFDWIVGNPPFTPMTIGYDILFRCMSLTNNLVFLMPWLTLINGQDRSDRLQTFGIKSVTHLPRNVFPASRVQCCVIHLEKGFNGNTNLNFYKRCVYKTFADNALH